MRVVQVNCVYPTGSTGKIVRSIHLNAIKRGWESYVFYGRGERIKESNVKKFSTEFEAKCHSLFSRATGEQFSYSFFSTKYLVSKIKSLKPDVVHLHCLNGHCVNLYSLLNYLKHSGIKTVLTLHAEIMHTAGCEHSIECERYKEICEKCTVVQGRITKIFRDDSKVCFLKMKHVMDGFDNLTVVGVSDWLLSRAKQSGVFKDCKCHFETVFNGVDTEVFRKKETYRRLDIVGSLPLILHVTPNFNHRLKGGERVIKFAQLHPEWQFLIVGYNGNYTLPNNIKTIRFTKNMDELVDIYNQADVTLLTSVRETFSMVCAESLCCGTPVVGFLAGGPESICLKQYSQFVQQDDYQSLSTAVKDHIQKKIPMEEMENVYNRYDEETMVTRYFDIYSR